MSDNLGRSEPRKKSYMPRSTWGIEISPPPVLYLNLESFLFDRKNFSEKSKHQTMRILRIIWLSCGLASAQTTTAAVPPWQTGVITEDGTCGGSTGWVCDPSWGACCSKDGRCGRSEAFCGDGWQVNQHNLLWDLSRIEILTSTIVSLKLVIATHQPQSHQDQEIHHQMDLAAVPTSSPVKAPALGTAVQPATSVATQPPTAGQDVNQASVPAQTTKHRLMEHAAVLPDIHVSALAREIAVAPPVIAVLDQASVVVVVSHSSGRAQLTRHLLMGPVVERMDISAQALRMGVAVVAPAIAVVQQRSVVLVVKWRLGHALKVIYLQMGHVAVPRNTSAKGPVSVIAVVPRATVAATPFTVSRLKTFH